MADEILEEATMDIQASVITARRAYYVKGTMNPFEAALDPELPSPGASLPGWPTVTAKRIVPEFWSYEQSKVSVHYNNRTLAEEDEGHQHGDTHGRWSWSTIRVKANVAPDGTYIIPDGWDGTPANLTAALDDDGNQRQDVGTDSGGVTTEMAVPVYHYSLWTTDKPNESDITRFYNKVNSHDYKGYGPWRFWCRGASYEETTTGNATDGPLYRINFEAALLDAPGGWQEVWQDMEYKEITVDGETRSKRLPVEPKFLSRIKEDTDFNDFVSLI